MNSSANKNESSNSNPSNSILSKLPSPNLITNLGPSPTNMLYYLTLIAPNVLVGFFVLLSLFNQNYKGLAYLVGITVLFQVSNTINTVMTLNNHDNPAKEICHSYGLFSSNGGLSYGVLIYVFTFMYLLIPMIINNIMNISLLGTLLLMIILDASVNIKQNCTNFVNVGFSVILGIIFGISWAFIIYSIAPKLTYHVDYITTNKLACSMPSEQKYKCKVMRNGEIIG
tara:strand:- start:5809 stop:6489 length:681 start_codon:yes stop_codon:yes gene_type:complete